MVDIFSQVSSCGDYVENEVIKAWRESSSSGEGMKKLFKEWGWGTKDGKVEEIGMASRQGYVVCCQRSVTQLDSCK